MKIPKVIFQTSYFKPPNCLKEKITSKAIDWEHKIFLDDEIIDFITNNPNDDFKDSLDIFNAIEENNNKIQYFIYYYLYLYGGIFININSVLEKDIETIDNNCIFFAVKSATNADTIFNGFMGSVAKNPIIFQILKYIHNINKENLNTNFHLVNKEISKIIDTYVTITNTILNEEIKENKIKILIENIENEENEEIAVTKYENEKILTHYFKNKSIITTLKNTKKIITKNKQIKIGITCNLPESAIQLFNNGIGQNVIYFGELLSNIGYDVNFIVVDKNLKKINEEEYKKIFYNDKFKIIKNSEILCSKLDLVFTMGFSTDLHINKMLRHMNVKIIYYSCGNSYFIDCEKILYNQHKAKQDIKYLSNKNDLIYDKIWCIPQMTNTNKYYLETLYRTECIEVPFIWSPKAISITASCYNIKDENELLYNKNESTHNKIGIFEPNISMMKWCFPALLVCENAYRKDPYKKINKVFLNNITDKTNTLNEFNLKGLNEIVKSLDLFEDKKISIEKRYNTLYFMKNFAEIAVSHQMENNLNYLYLDLAWMGWPIVHNASLCKDIGYYYTGFDYEMGGKILNEVMMIHEKEKDKYLIKNRQIIDRYLPSNKELQKKYKKLIDKIFI
jgi:hypothetical protein